MRDGEDSDDPPWPGRLREFLLPAMRDLLQRSGIEGSGAYSCYDSRIRRGQAFLEHEIVPARKLPSCGLAIHRVDEVGSGFGQLMFLLGWSGLKTVGFEVNPLRGRPAAALHGMRERVERAALRRLRPA